MNSTKPKQPNSQPSEPTTLASDAIATVTEAATQVGNLAGEALESASQNARNLLEQATQATGSTLSNLANNPLLKFMTDKLGASWLKTMLGGVDVEKVRAKVEKLQQQYPQETPSQIAHRLTLDKVLSAAGVGFATNIIPPIAAALLGIELAATAALQAEMVYEIAAAYGLDLKQPARRGEVAAIFGLALGTDVLKGGLGLIEILPGIGAIVGASSNAVMFYGLGFTASRFYEAKQQSQTQPMSAERLRQESQTYNETLLVQRELMDRVLVRAVSASYPERSLSEILPELKEAGLSPKTIATLETYWHEPQPLDDLLDRLEPDFLVLLLTQCERLAASKGTTNAEEAALVEAIRQRL
ncbi:MAG: hypothetical protein SVX43_11885 [Cyanobacteriota bacterium]|nr:hypothetical protein [Cyanobacteriota bacterium]